MLRIFKIFKLKKVWIPLLIVGLIVYWVVYTRARNAQPTYTTETVKRQDLKQTVSVTGTVKAAEQIDLNFKTSGRLVAIDVKVGDMVKPKERLAKLESSDAEAAVLTARANLKSVEAALAKLRAGAQVEDIAVTRAAVDSAQTALNNARQAYDNTVASQQQAVTNAFAQLVGLTPVATPSAGNTSTVTITVSGTYTGKNFGFYKIQLFNDGSYKVSGLEDVSYIGVSRTTTTPLGSNGLKIQFSSTGTMIPGDIWEIDIPNTSNVSYAVYKSAYDAALTTQKQQVDAAQAAVKTAEQALTQAQAQLAFKEAPARSYDITNAEAQVDSARAAQLRAQNDLDDRSILAPVAGIITRVNNQVGETNSLTSPVIVLLADGKYEIEVQVPEADVAKLAVGQTVDTTLDALGSSEHFSGHITFVDPASTVIQDVVYYKTTIMFDNSDERVKPGMTANIDVKTAERNNVLVVPQRAVKYRDRQPYVEVLLGDKVESKDVSIGLKGDDGLVEVLSGLGEGDKAITFKSNGK